MSTNCSNGIGMLACVVLSGLLATAALAQNSIEQTKGLDVHWNESYTGVTFTFKGQTHRYPEDLADMTFPAPGQPPDIQTASEWPVTTIHAKWSVAAKDWPEAYRGVALDWILIRGTDAPTYPSLFPDVVLEAEFLGQPAHLAGKGEPTLEGYAESMRGKDIAYQMTAEAGFAAEDYQIRSKIRTGVSADGKTVICHDQPEYISAHLLRREYIMVAHDLGDRICLEVSILCVSAPRRFMRGEAVRRVIRDCEYMIRRMQEVLTKPPTVQQVQTYLKQVEARRKAATPPSSASPASKDQN